MDLPPPAESGNRWVLGARPKTLPAAVVPVMVGTGVALAEHGASWWKAVLALVVSLALQIATNYVNDYADGERGTDAVRVGPVRLVGSGLATPAAVKRAALAAFGVAAAAGLVLVVTTAWWLVLVGAACMAAGWAYTGGPAPYGYAGLGELFVFVCFGLVATAGSAFVQTQRLTALGLVASVPVGALACALLVINNLRDIPGDTVAGKRTLAVRLGDAATRRVFVGLCAIGAIGGVAVAAVASSPWPLVAAAAGLVAIAPVRTVLGGARGPALIPVLGATAKAQIALGVLLTAGLAGVAL